MITKFQFILVFLASIFLYLKSDAQQIIYDLPKEVTKNLEDHISVRGAKQIRSCMLSKNVSNKYSITLIDDDFSKLDNFKIIHETLIKNTTRFLRVGKALIPIITDDDFQFADFGSIETPNSGSEKRKIGKKKVVFTSEGYTIIFDRSGKIYNQ